ncbi:uncharacterized protein [Triticum aestivum]|uniref:uncharacterized protein n=1 Tax=Triticum aestivum TaxID=4565 RepID=UPI001D02E3D6|nr:uncharacterized protein LOC123057007 [Triticum aestivum]
MAALRHAARGLIGGQAQAVRKAVASPLLAHRGRTASFPLLRSLSSSSSSNGAAAAAQTRSRNSSSADSEPVYVRVEPQPDPETARLMAEMDTRKQQLFDLLADMDMRRPRPTYTCTADVYEVNPTASSDTPVLIPITPSDANVE